MTVEHTRLTNRTVSSMTGACLIVFTLCPSMALAQQDAGARGTTKVALVKMPYSGARNVSELSGGPDYLEHGGIGESLRRMGVTLKPTDNVRLTPEEEGDYGNWHRMAMANAHLADIVADNTRQGYISVGLLSNCTSLLGVLGGLQHSGPTRRPRKVGMVFIDAHGDFNTPESTLSGMLGGMPVAVSAGMALTNLRLESGLQPAMPTRYIVLGAVRDVDPLEQELLDRSNVEMLTVDDFRTGSENIHRQMRRLSELTDVIYIHIDMDVLDPPEVAGHPLTVPNGPTSQELAAALTEMFKYEKVAALGVASTPWGERDEQNLSRQAAYNLIEGAVRGVQGR